MPRTVMALTGRDGQRFSQAPQPMHWFSVTVGIWNWETSLLTIRMAPDGQWYEQLPQLSCPLAAMQSSRLTCAMPIWIVCFSPGATGRMAPAGQTWLQALHSGRQ